MSKAGDLIEQAEALAGCRWDDENNPNGFYALLGAVAREMGRNPHQAKDDVAAGTLLAFEMSEAGQRKRQSEAMIAQMLTAGMSPDDLAALLGTK